MKKNQLFFLLFIAILFLSACAGDNFEDKYPAKPSIDNPEGKLAHFALDGTLENSEETGYHLFLYGEETYSDGGVGGSQALELNGESNYLAIPIGVHDTLSIVFWVRMNGENFREKNANPVWLDYSAGAVKVAVDGITGSTKLLMTENSRSDVETSLLLPNGEWENICTWQKRAFFYTEILSDSVTYRIKTQHEEDNMKDYTLRVSLKESPLDLKSEWLYIGKPSGMETAVGKYLEGIIDDIDIYNRGLTEDEVKSFAQVSLE